MKARMIYTEKNGFMLGESYSNPDGQNDASRVAPDQLFDDEYRKLTRVESIYESETQPVIELWEVKESFCVHPYRFFCLIYKYGLFFELYFPDWPDLLHFMKEYLPTLKGRD